MLNNVIAIMIMMINTHYEWLRLRKKWKFQALWLHYQLHAFL